MTSTSTAAARLPATTAAELGTALIEALGRVVRGKGEALRLTVVALLSGQHLLLEDVPGVGKTLLSKALARAVGGDLGRVQATPDLMPADITGVSVYQQAIGAWEFHPGPLFHHVVLVDELNRATPRTQSALLEAMEERHVTVDGVTRALPDPFFVVATQNPFEHHGTFPLVEGQRDRFGLVVQLGLPARPAERELLLGTGGSGALDQLQPVCPPAAIPAAVRLVRGVHCAPALADYVLDLVDATRRHPDVRLGASPRASLGLLHAAKAHAVLAGRGYATPDDVRAVAPAALAHRLVVDGTAELDSATALVRRLVDTVPVPRG